MGWRCQDCGLLCDLRPEDEEGEEEEPGKDEEGGNEEVQEEQVGEVDEKGRRNEEVGGEGR